MKPVRIILFSLVCGIISTAHADIASVQYVQSIITSLEPPEQAQADWDQDDSSAADYIQNKPTIPSTAADVGAVAATQATTGGILTTNATTGVVEVSTTIAESKVENLTSDLAAKQDVQIGAAGDAGKALVVANDGTISMSANTLGTAAYTASTAYDASGTAAGLVGTLSNLTTTDKTSVVAAINEVKGSISNIDTGVASVSEGSTNGTIDVDGTDVAVHGLGTAAYTAATDYVPTSRTVNSKVLSSDITLTASDVGAEATANKSTSSTYATDLANNSKKDVNYPTLAATEQIAINAAADAASDIVNGISDDGSGGNVVVDVFPNDGVIGFTRGFAYDTIDVIGEGSVVTSIGQSDDDNVIVATMGTLSASDVDAVPTSRTVNGSALSSNVTLDGADIALTGYTKPNATSAIAAADTINAAIGKLETALDGKQASGSYVPTTTTVAGHALSSNVTLSNSDVGLGNVQNVDQTNAANITSGTMSVARLPVGTTSTTVAAGDDARFDSVPTSQPAGTPPTGRVWVWFN